jgi:hypothetical protein
MLKLKQDNNGFSVFELVIIIVIVGLIGVVGWMVYKNHHKTVASSVTASTTKSIPNTPAKPATPSTPASYFTISQWGIRAPYSGALALQYVQDTNPTNRMFVSSTQLNEGGPSICTTANGGAGYIGRYLPSDDIPTEGPPAETAQAFVSQNFAATNTVPPAYSKVGNYYYIYFDSSNDCSNTTIQTQTTQAFTNIVDSLVAY